MKKTRAKGTQSTIPVTRPTLEPYDMYAPLFEKPIQSGMLTTHVHVAEFEKRVAKYLGVKHAIAVSSCTAGLMLVLKGLGLKGEVIVPSFTFAATAHPLVWNNLAPVFADVEPGTYTLDPLSVEKHITKKTSAILATHVFGVVCDVKKLQALARTHKLKLIFDAAHAFGSTRDGVRVGNFGDAEVFSLSPIKVLTAVEGGIVATNSDTLAQYVRLGRNYGDDGTNNMLFVGLSARMSEFHAAVGLRSLAKLPANLKNRHAKAQYLLAGLKKIEPKLRFQIIPPHTTTTYYIFSIYIDPSVLGYTRDMLFDFFATQGISARKYFYPPLHKQTAYAGVSVTKGSLVVTDTVAESVLSLPLYSHIAKGDMDRVLRAFRDFTNNHHAQ